MATKGSRGASVPHKLSIPPGTDNFEFDLVDAFTEYASSVDPTITNPNTLIRGSLNVYKKISGTIANRHGQKLYDAVVDSTSAKIDSAYVWNTSLGVTFPLRVSNKLLQVYSTISGTGAWYTLMSALAQTRFIFDTWWNNTDKKDKVLFVQHDANTYAWDGGMALFVSATSNVITLDRDAATAGFASSGSVTIGSNSYTYAALSGSTLTGAQDASAEVLNSVVISKVITNSNTPVSGFTNDFIKVVGNQLYSGSYASQLIYLSKNTDYTDHTQSTPRLTGEGDVITLDGVGKGIGVHQDQAYIFAGTNFIHPISFSQITVGTTLSEQTKRGKLDLGNLVAAQGQEFIDNLSDNIIYLDQANQLRTFGIFRNLSTEKAALLSQAVQEELAETDFTNGQLKVISDRRGDLIYLTAPNTGYTYIYQERTNVDPTGVILTERLWQPPMIWNVTRIYSIGGKTYGFSNANPQIYQLWDTGQWHDDSPSGQLPYACIALFAYQNGGRRQGKIAFEKWYAEGYATQGTQLYGAIYYDYQGSTATLSTIFNDTTQASPFSKVFTGLVPPSLGGASLGDNPLGDGLNILPDDQATVPKFRNINGMQGINVYEFAPMFYSQQADARWEILSFGMNIHLSDTETPAELQK